MINNLLTLLPKDQVDIVLEQDYCELDCSFLGFTDIYEHLSCIIPEHFSIIDFGCYLATQSFYFQNHKSYTGVDLTELKRFKFENTTHYIKSIQRFIVEDLHKYDLDETFVICSYVPDDKASSMIREKCKNIFIFYPSNKNEQIVLKNAMRKIITTIEEHPEILDDIVDKIKEKNDSSNKQNPSSRD